MNPGVSEGHDDDVVHGARDLAPGPSDYLNDARGLVHLVELALHEDAPTGDLTEPMIGQGPPLSAVFVARETGVFSGRAALREVFRQLGPSVNLEIALAEGDRFEAGREIARVSGPAHLILRGEQVALNFITRLSAIASLTARFVAAVEGCVSYSGAQVLITDTRKTTPGLRSLEKAAVRAGGGVNHRMSLSEGALLKDNHLALAGASAANLTEWLRRAKRTLPPGRWLEVEVDIPDQIDAVLGAGVERILLDNFSLPDLRAAVLHVAGRARLEASGGVRLDTVRAIALTGVDVISVGAITHSAGQIDIGLDEAV